MDYPRAAKTAVCTAIVWFGARSLLPAIWPDSGVARFFVENEPRMPLVIALASFYGTCASLMVDVFFQMRASL